MNGLGGGDGSSPAPPPRPGRPAERQVSMSTDRPIPTLYAMIATPAPDPRGARAVQIVRSRTVIPSKEEGERSRQDREWKVRAQAAAAKAGLVGLGTPIPDAGRAIESWLVSENGLPITEAEAMTLDQVIEMLAGEAPASDGQNMPSSWFKEEFGLTAEALYAQAKRGKLRKQKVGRWNRYSVADAMRIWPDLVTYGPSRS
jgi:hypothetical protein